MLEVDVSLEFACDLCRDPIQAKLKCSGKGVCQGSHAVAAVNLPCPHCQAVNQVIFELSGMILHIDSKQQTISLEPSIN